MKISNEYILREVAGNNIVVPVGSKAIDFNAVCYLNEVGSFIFTTLQQNDLSFDELFDKILAEFEIDRDTVINDTKAYLDKLEKAKLLEK